MFFNNKKIFKSTKQKYNIIYFDLIMLLALDGIDPEKVLEALIKDPGRIEDVVEHYKKINLKSTKEKREEHYYRILQWTMLSLLEDGFDVSEFLKEHLDNIKKIMNKRAS